MRELTAAETDRLVKAMFKKHAAHSRYREFTENDLYRVVSTVVLDTLLVASGELDVEDFE